MRGDLWHRRNNHERHVHPQRVYGSPDGFAIFGWMPAAVRVYKPIMVTPCRQFALWVAFGKLRLSVNPFNLLLHLIHTALAKDAASFRHDIQCTARQAANSGETARHHSKWHAKLLAPLYEKSCAVQVSCDLGARLVWDKHVPVRLWLYDATKHHHGEGLVPEQARRKHGEDRCIGQGVGHEKSHTCGRRTLVELLEAIFTYRSVLRHHAHPLEAQLREDVAVRRGLLLQLLQHNVALRRDDNTKAIHCVCFNQRAEKSQAEEGVCDVGLHSRGDDHLRLLEVVQGNSYLVGTVQEFCTFVRLIRRDANLLLARADDKMLRALHCVDDRRENGLPDERNGSNECDGIVHVEALYHVPDRIIRASTIHANVSTAECVLEPFFVAAHGQAHSLRRIVRGRALPQRLDRRALRVS
mmetsp:Transcript_154871/g.288800  ORF Transcript_154871/g.288800 Transcript_154871/m.288800 type:complete len:412 (+) Transcript_154871:381-1616(+)